MLARGQRRRRWEEDKEEWGERVFLGQRRVTHSVVCFIFKSVVGGGGEARTMGTNEGSCGEREEGRALKTRCMRKFSSPYIAVFRLKTEMCDASSGRPNLHAEERPSNKVLMILNTIAGWSRTLCFAYVARSSRAPMVSLNFSEWVNFPTHTPRDTSWSRAMLVARFMTSSRT